MSARALDGQFAVEVLFLMGHRMLAFLAHLKGSGLDRYDCEAMRGAARTVPSTLMHVMCADHEFPLRSSDHSILA